MKMKKILTIVLLIFSVISLCSYADEAVLFASFDGDGTKESPYLISDADDFITFTNALNSGEQYKNKYFRQTANIDLAGNNDYVGCASSGAFYGIYDGNGNTINMALNAASERNPFPYVYGTIMNLGTTGTLTNTGANYTVGIARSIRSGAVLANCYSTMKITTNANAAGLAASGNGILNNCYFAGTLKGSSNFAIAASSSGGSYTGCYYTVGTLGGNMSGKKITDDEAKTTLAGMLNDGRMGAASAAGVNINEIWYWASNDSYPAHTKDPADTGITGEGTKPPADTGITGEGTKSDPYIINSAEDFIIFTNMLNAGEKYKDEYFKQTEDIDLSGNEKYEGTLKFGEFYGFYDGCGNIINIDLTAEEERNIFPYVYGTIINLGTTGSLTTTGASYTVGIARSIRTGAVLANCYSTLNITSNANVAGLCGSGNGTLNNCYFAGSLKGSSNFAIAASSNGGSYMNCYSTVGNIGNGVSGIKITEETAKTTLAETLNEGREGAAAAAGVTKKEMSLWTNRNGLAEHFIPQYEEIIPDISKTYIEAGTSEHTTITANADYIGYWTVDKGNSDVTYSVSADAKTLTITAGSLAGKVVVNAYSDDDILISDNIVITVHSSKKTAPGLNMLNGLDTAADFEDGFSYGMKNVRGTTLNAGAVPKVDYTASKDAEGNPAESLKNTSKMALVSDGSAIHAGDAWYFVVNTSVSGLEKNREYSAYAQIYTNPEKAEKSYAYFNNFKTSNAYAPMTVTYNSRTNSWKEYKYSGTYDKDASVSPAFNTRQESFNGDAPSTITVSAVDNVYIIPHYNITYHYLDGTTETVSFNPVEKEFPLVLAKTYSPEKTYEAGNYTDSETGKTSYYSGKWSVEKNGTGFDMITLENKDIDLYPEKLTDGVTVYYVDSLESVDMSFDENAYVTDTYNSANITGNGTKNITIQGKGYNASFEIKSESGSVLAYVYLEGTHKWRPGLNIFNGTPEAFDMENEHVFDKTEGVSITENPVIDNENSTSKAVKISQGAAYNTAYITFETPLEYDRPVLLGYDYTGLLNGSFWNLMNDIHSSSILSTVSAPDKSKWQHLQTVICGLLKVDKNTHPEFNKLAISATGIANNLNYALYLDNIYMIPSYKVEFFDEKGNKIDKTSYYPRRVETADYFSNKVYKVDFNPNTRYIVNGEPIVTNGYYELKYEDLKITVLPNNNAVMFSGDNAATEIPSGDTYRIPYPHELPGFTAEYFITWEDKDGNEIRPGTVVSTSDVVGTTLYARCNESAFTRLPANGAVVNFASEQYNNWRANYQISSMIARSDGTYETEKGVVFKWQAVDSAKKYTVLYSENKDMSDAFSIDTDKPTATAHYLFAATDYYWQIKTTLENNETVLSDVWKFTTADIHRILPGINNFRDAGGRLTEDGKYRMKQGIIYRGQAVSSGNRAIFDRHGIIADLDLRGAETGWITESPAGSDLIFKIIEGTHYYGNETSVKHYANKVGQEKFAEEIRFFTDPSHYPMYFHCAGGRDRTGMLAYIIGGICGVPEEELFRDYELTWLSSNTCGTDETLKLSITWMRGFTAYINKNFEGETFKEKMEGYVRLCGVTDEEMDKIRAILLEEVEPKTQTMVTKYPEHVKCDVFMTNIPEESTVLVAGYYEGRLVYNHIKPITSDVEGFEIPEKIDEVKVFVFDDAKAIKPITECETIAVK